ncbi:RHS repeat-associated core domain-containing protein [Nonomuraea sp. NPDC000554]|uniref:RHS repeat-associated core domain-containing protein n=1 Tax=Nonomuraea sp. NPDC000554 TaxID=3154259 RepID=UPI0033205C17
MNTATAANNQNVFDVPKQLMGAAADLSNLVTASAVDATSDRKRVAKPKKPVRPRGALPLDVRPAVRAVTESKLPAGVERAEQLDRSTQAGSTFPIIDDVYPDNGLLIGTVTPLLTVKATRLGGGTEANLKFFFKICEKPGPVEDPSEPAPTPMCAESGGQMGEDTWRVPAGKLEWGKQYEWWVRVADPESGADATSAKQLITMGARQPLTGAHLGELGADGQEFAPVSGNYVTTVVDARVVVAGPPLSVVRTYNSLDGRVDGMFGAGWSTSWDMKIVAERTAAGAVTGLLVTYPNGSRVRFAAKGDGTYQAPPGMHVVLADVAGGGWRLMDTSSTSYHFDASGRLLKIVDARGRSQTLVYGGDGKLGQVTALGGRSLHFTWQGPRVASVSTDPVDGKSLTWTYTYTGDNLTAVCAPVAAPNCTSYAYGDGSRYRSIVLDSEPVGYFRLGEGQFGTPINEGSSGSSGFYKDVTLGQPGALDGSTDTAAVFTKSHMELPSNILARLRDRVSIEGWFKTSQNGIIFSAGEFGYEFGATQPVLYVGTDGRLRGQLGNIRNGNGDWVYSPVTTVNPVNDNQWHHVVLNVDANRQKLFLDGSAVGEVTGDFYPDYRSYSFVGSGDRASSWSDVPGGPNTTGAFAFKGSIDEFALYDKPLTDAEIEAHYAGRAKVTNKLEKITLPSGRTRAVNTYDTATDRLKTHTDRYGGTWQVGKPDTDWEAKVPIVTVTDPRNGTLRYGYDDGRVSRLVYVIDQKKFKTSYEYDTGGFLAKVTDRNGNVVKWSNDKRGNPLSGTSCRTANNCQTAYATYYLNKDDEFDARNGRQLTNRDARSSSATDNTYATTYDYNTYGEPTKETTPPTPDFPNGRSTSATYTDGSEPAVNGGTTPAGLVKTRTDAKGNAWTYRYTAAGDLAEQTDPAGLVTKLDYDALGRVVAKTDVSQAHPDGVKTTFTYDALSRPVIQTEPGAKNELFGVTHTKRTTFAYDPDGNKLSDTIADLTGGDAERATVYTYDTHGQVEAVTDPEGGVVRQEWNPLGQLARTTDARGTVVENGYNERGELSSRTLKGWIGSPVNPQPAKDVVLEQFYYDAGGRLSDQVDAMGRITSYKYFADNRLAQKIGHDVKLNGSTTPRDVVLEDHTYDNAGNETKLITGGGIATAEFEYDATGRLTSQLFAPGLLNRRTVFVYDANGNTLKTTRTGIGSTRTEITEYAYNKANQVTKETVENGAVDLVSTTDYDDRGLVTARTDPRGNVTGANKADFTTTLRYDLLGRLVEATGPEVKVDKAGSASTAHPTARYGYDTLGAKTHETDAESRTLTSTFDKAGRLTGQSAPAYTPPGGTAVTPTTKNAYDKAGQLISVTDPRGYVRMFDYDQLGRQVRVTDPAPDGQTPGRWITEYDLVGERLAAVDPNGARVQATFDDLGRQITQTVIERKPATASYITTMTYDDAGYLTKTVAPGNRTTSYTVNAAGEVLTQTDPATNKTTMDYDLAGRLVKITDARGNATTAEYDLAGRKIGTKDLDYKGATVRSSSIGYDSAGNPTSSTSPEGHVTKQTFDALGRVTSLIEPVSDSESITTSFGYDATGARTRLTDGRGNATWTSYNSLGLVETVSEPSTTAHPNAADRTWTAVYDQAGNAVAELQPGGVRIDRTFDHLGRLTKESGAGGGAASAERTFGYDLAGHQTAIGDLTVDYNDRSLPLAITRASVQQTAYTYDELGNPTQRVDAAGTSTYTWDKASRLATAVDPVTGRKLTYGYDEVSNLTSLTAFKGSTITDTQALTYDAVDRLTSQTLVKGGITTGTQLAQSIYDYDKDDNLTSKTATGTAGAGTNTYTYDHAGRLTSWTAPGGATTTYGWDAAGNRTKVGGKTYTYDERNRLTSGDGTTYTYTPRGTLATETKNGTTTQLTFDAFDRLIADGDSLYSYDALDRVTSRIKGATKQTFAYAGLANDLAAISDTSGGIQAKYGRDASGALLGQQEGTNPALATMTDLHGDLVATYDTNNLATTTAYDPFGTVTAQTGAKTNLGYQGEYTDPDTGKVNMHARWYQPGTGTFTTRDTATLNPNPSVQANRYTYANASPLTGIDPTGHYTSGLGFDTMGGNSGSPTSGGGTGISFGGFNSGTSGYGGTGSGGIADMCSFGVCVGGGGYVCSGGMCAETFTNQQWWSDYITSPGYDYLNKPLMSDEEAKRQGLMPNGRPAPAGFWNGSSLVQEVYMRSWTSTVSDRDLQKHWDFLREVLDEHPANGPKHGRSGGGRYNDDPIDIDDEWAWCKKNKSECGEAASISLEVTIYLKGKGRNRKWQYGEENAVRHFLWQASLAYMISQKAAVEFGDAHEKGEKCKDEKECDTQADAYNNSVARLWAKNHKEQLNEFKKRATADYHYNYAFSYGVWFDQLFGVAEDLWNRGQLHSPRRRYECQGRTGNVPNCA